MNSKKLDVQKNWKTKHEKNKLNSIKLNQDYNLFSVALLQHKNQNEKIIYSKNPTIQRYYSEKGFKKPITQSYLSNRNNQPNIKAEEEYFPDMCSPGSKNGKQPKLTDSHQKLDKYNVNSKINMKQKKNNEIINIKTNNLKETSSTTQSAENLGASKSVPQFVKNKFLKINPIGQNFYPKISTPRNKLQNFKIICKLGQGKFGKVFLVKQINTGFILAMKIVEKKRIIKQNLLQQFIREMRIQSFLNHPHIISLYGFFVDQTHFYTLMQLGCDGQLFSLIEARKIITQQTTSFIIKNLLQAINYIHYNKVLHRDIKPQNIVLVMGNVKICDFGWAVNKLHPGDLRNTFCGTPLYLSPQIIQGSLYNQKVDLWAIGVLAFQLYLGCTPFDINDPSDLYRIITEPLQFPTNRQISNQFKQFINAMLSKNPGQRLASHSLLQMDFITKYGDFQTCEELCK